MIERLNREPRVGDRIELPEPHSQFIPRADGGRIVSTFRVRRRKKTRKKPLFEIHIETQRDEETEVHKEVWEIYEPS
jgi:hypothetical protein